MEFYSEYNLLYNRFLKFKKKVQGGFGKEDIHQFRVSLKKIRSIFLLVELLEPKVFSGKKHYKTLRPMFKSAGRIREIQINHQLLKNFPMSQQTLDQFIAHNQKVIFSSKLELADLIENFDQDELTKMNTLIYAIIKKNRKRQLKKKSSKFIQKKLKQINKITKKAHSIDNLHKIRIILKQAYAVAIIGSKLKYDFVTKKELKLFKKIEVMIGDWHDRIGLLEALEEWRDTAPHLQETAAKELDEIIKIVKNEEKFFRNKLI